MADFIFVDTDIFRTSNPAEIRATRVLETWVGGQQVWSRSRPAAVTR